MRPHGTGATPPRSVRVSDEVWRGAGAVAAARSETLTDAIVGFLRAYGTGRVDRHEWVADHGEMATVAQMLLDANLVDPAGMVDFIEKPWKWSAERDRWVVAGRPVPPWKGGPGTDSAGWDEFVDRMQDRAPLW